MLITLRPPQHAVMPAAALWPGGNPSDRAMARFSIGPPIAPWGVQHPVDVMVSRASAELTIACQSGCLEFMCCKPAHENRVPFQILLGC